MNQFITTPKKNKSKNETSIIKNLPKKKNRERINIFIAKFCCCNFSLDHIFFCENLNSKREKKKKNNKIKTT